MPPSQPPSRPGRGAGDTRRRVLAAARDLLGSEEPVDFTVDQVARRAGVSRMTVYYQFGGRSGLLDAVLDDLGSSGGMERVPDAMRREPADAALAALVELFTAFWSSQRAVIRRLRALAVLDPELSGVFRDERRRWMLHSLLTRTPGAAQPSAETLDVLQVLTGFEVYDGLATPERSADEVAAIVTRLVRLAVSAH